MAYHIEEIIENALVRYLDIHNPSLGADLAGIAVPCHAKAKDTIRRPNENKPYLMCIISGVVRGYHVGEHGRYYTIFFADHEGDPFWFPELKTMDKCGFDALTDIDYINIPWAEFCRIIGNYGLLYEVRERFLRHRVEDQFQHRLIFQIYDATSRYLLFREEYPGLENRIKDEYIADYLGITNVSLSRIRRKLKENARTKKGNSNGS